MRKIQTMFRGGLFLFFEIHGFSALEHSGYFIFSISESLDSRAFVVCRSCPHREEECRWMLDRIY